MPADFDYVLTVRKKGGNGVFSDEVGDPTYLIVPENTEIEDATEIEDSNIWCGNVLNSSAWKNESGEDRGDILFIVHGYNNSVADVLDRHRRLAGDLKFLGYKGTVVSFDWPSSNCALAYLSDRHKAQETAMALVDGGIRLLSQKQKPTCQTNIHILAHSTGAFVIREGFYDADQATLDNYGWLVSQLVFIAGDVSSDSMGESDRVAASIYRHCVRLTNYSNRCDSVLDLSNVKRMGAAPRVGRVGLPGDAPSKAVNVDCTDYFKRLIASPAMKKAEQPKGITGAQSHSWYFGNKTFAQDLFEIVIGTDRFVASRRDLDESGLHLT
ncbi:alpha/beta hydrolase [Ralstonia pseudosolanacearum]|uniref:alpha/beta hydrolase n=1 Tax=Ralstonia pseudosolanacearum TaxID=1310165 RepID=UPI001FF8FA24|nr:alpha/beta hydrolase [Ralstonia pseudosolanacearum]